MKRQFKKKKKGLTKLNLIPIMDAVFIFIFFLLMSAQFIKIHEIGSDNPAVKMLTEDQEKDKDPLNLIIEISKSSVIVRTGLDERVFKKMSYSDITVIKKELQKHIMGLKKKHPKENTVILRPKKSVSYKNIVHVMDAVRTALPEQKDFQGKLFEQIVFEPLG